MARQDLRNRYKYIVISLMLINLILVELNIGIWIKSAWDRLYIASDFTVYYAAFTMVREGEADNLYNREVESKFQQRVMGDMMFEGGWLPYPIPPLFALVFFYFSHIPFSAAYFIWSIIEVGLVYWLIHLLNGIFINWDRQQKLMSLTILLAFWPLAHTILLGQLSIFLLICLIKIYILLKQSRYAKAGFWLGLLVLKPQTILFPAMIALNKRSWRMIASAFLTVLFGVAVSSVIFGIRPWINYLHLLQTMTSAFGQSGVFPEHEFTIRGTLFNLLGASEGSLINIISIFTLLIGMLLVFQLWRKKSSPDMGSFQLRFALMITLSTILSLHLFDHDSLVIIFPMALLYDFLQQFKLPWRGYSIFVMVTPLVFFISAFSSFNLFGIIRPPVIIELVLLGWIGYYLVYEKRLLKTSPSNLAQPAAQSEWLNENPTR